MVEVLVDEEEAEKDMIKLIRLSKTAKVYHKDVKNRKVIWIQG